MIYFDHHATTPVAQEVIDAMLPMFGEQFANAGSVTHQFGRDVGDIVQRAIEDIAHTIGGVGDELVITSGATESNNLALLGLCTHPRQKRRKIVSVVTEHRAVIDPLQRLSKLGFEIQWVGVCGQSESCPGLVDMEALAAAIDDDTAVVSLMLANNEIGVIQPLAEIAALCRQRGVWLHTDATQAVGRIEVDVDLLDVDLLSFSAHKFYGPKGVGGLYVRRRDRKVRLASQIVGGGQQHNIRSGTLNTAGIVGMQAALQLCKTENDWRGVLGAEPRWKRTARLRDLLWEQLSAQIPGVKLNGPSLTLPTPAAAPVRLPGNLNCSFAPVEGQSLMLKTPNLAVSSGSACTSSEPGVSHVLTALGLSEDAARSSLRFGLGRSNTADEVKQAVQWLAAAVAELRDLI